MATYTPSHDFAPPYRHGFGVETIKQDLETWAQAFPSDLRLHFYSHLRLSSCF